MILFNTHIGRLGNKMFIYAFGFANWKQTGLNFCVDEPVLFEIFTINRVAKFKNFIFLKYFWWITHKFFFKGNTDLTDCTVIHTQNQIKPNSIVTGYFLSPLYFEKYHNQIAKIFKIRTKYREIYQKKISESSFKLPLMVIHIRRTDYQYHQIQNSNKTGSILPLSYYQKVLSLEEIEKYTLVFISDDIEFCQQHFSNYDGAYFSENDYLIDFQLMLNASICVIANSTFSWWAAYLNTIKLKVFAPKYFLGYAEKTEYPKSIYPKEWTQIEP